MQLLLILRQGDWFGRSTGEFEAVKSLPQVREHVDFAHDFETSRMILVKNSPVRLGRKRDSNEVILDDGAVSKQHCMLTQEGEDWYIQDAGSRNGTFVDGTRIADKTQLLSGRIIKLGNVLLETRVTI